MPNLEHMNYYRRIGDQEQQGTEPQPATPITPRAKKKLERWGLSTEQIETFCNFCASFRYDLCPERLTRFLQHPIFYDEQQSQVTLPYFYDLKGRLDGQCSDLAKQFVIQMQFSGLLTDLNEQLQLKNGLSLTTSYICGNSKTHFCLPYDTHVWNGLTLIDSAGIVKDMVMVDTAFQQITTLRESGCQIRNQYHDFSSIINMRVQNTVDVGWVEIDHQNWQHSDPVNTIVLGISKDRKYSYALGILKRKNLGNQSGPASQLLFFLERIHADGCSDSFLLNPDTLDLLSENTKVPLTPPEETEILELLSIGNTAQYTTDPSALAFDTSHRYTISFDT